MAKKKQEVFKQPVYRGGNAALKSFIGQALRYPQEALDERVEGTVSIRFSINHKGKVTETKVIQGIGHGCDEEAIRLVKLLEYEVEKNRGLRVIFHKTLQIHFHLPAAPVAPEPKPEEQQTQQPEPQMGGYHYTVVPKKVEESADEEPAKKSYTYTITLGGS